MDRHAITKWSCRGRYRLFHGRSENRFGSNHEHVFLFFPGFTLLELLLVIGIIGLLTALVAPAIRHSRDQVLRAHCGTVLHNLAACMLIYTSEFDAWLPGSPNTSNLHTRDNGQIKWHNRGYGYVDPAITNKGRLRPASPIMNEQQPLATDPWDWGSCLMPYLNVKPKATLRSRQPQTRKGPFRCPANEESRFSYHYTNKHRIGSYLISAFFFLADENVAPDRPATDQSYGYLPAGYLPRLDRMKNAGRKIYLADGARFCTIDLGDNYHNQVDSATDGFADFGAWRKTIKLNAYRTFSVENAIYLEPFSFRHSDGINAAFFDGHVEWLPNGTTSDNSGRGSGARTAAFWFPKNTNTANLFGKDEGEPSIIVDE